LTFKKVNDYTDYKQDCTDIYVITDLTDFCHCAVAFATPSQRHSPSVIARSPLATLVISHNIIFYEIYPSVNQIKSQYVFLLTNSYI